jgi:hypothetical protein
MAKKPKKTHGFVVWLLEDHCLHTELLSAILRGIGGLLHWLLHIH